MSEAGKGPDEDPKKGRTSKAALRIEAFRDLRVSPMRSRKTADDDAKAGEKIADSARGKEDDAPLAAGPSRLAAIHAYREQQRNKPQSRALVATRWTPIGPSAVRKGQAVGDPVVSGRVSSIAVTPDGSRVYVGSANGGVWRSEDGGDTWTPLMDAFDLNPQGHNADSLAVGALALVPGATAADDTLYVGTGEAVGSGADPTGGPMFGVGPVVSTDGGQNWQTEMGAPGGPWSRLESNGFFELAVDPSEPTRVLAATLTGLFLREPAPLSTGFFRWRHIRLPGLSHATPVTSVVAAQAPGEDSVFFAAAKGGPVFRSEDGGETWSEVGSGLPTNLERVRLGIEGSRPDVLYLFSADFRLFRFDPGNDTWRSVRQLNTAITGSSSAQVANVNGDWNLAIAVAPNSVDRVYLGGGASAADENGYLNINIANFGASIFRCDLEVTLNETTGAISNLTNTLHYIGASVHPDVHALVFPPGDPDQLWVGCDGGVFYSDNPPGDDGGLIATSTAPRFYFEAKNTGLQTLMMHHLGQHPTEEAVLFGGTQDNGCLRFTGEAAWLHVQSGDCGWVVVNPNDPYKVVAGLQFQRSAARPLMVRSNFGGNLGSFDILDDRPSNVTINTLFYYPLAGPPPGSSDPRLLAFGSVQPWISENFGRTWRTVPSGTPANDALVGPILAIEFQSADRFYVGTHTRPPAFSEMGVYRFDRNGTTFIPTRLDRLLGVELLPFDGSVTDIAIDWADSTGRSIYATFGGFGDFGHVWHYDGVSWRRRDGGNPGQAGSLLDVSHNAIVVDPENPQTIYVGADVGVWRSTDSGQSWAPFEEGLPDVAVTDLKLHPTRVLRVATHGRGVFERRIDESSVHHIELFIRDTTLDRGRRATEDGLDNPLQRHTQVWHWRGPDIKLDFPDRHGNVQFDAGRSIDFATFTDVLRDDGVGAGNTLRAGDAHHVYAQIHNRGRETASSVQVMALITHATVGVPPLPPDYEDNVQQGTPISNDDWETIGTTILDGVSARVPQIARFVIPPEKLPPTGPDGSFGYSVLLLVHHAEDDYPVTLLEQPPGGGPQFRVIPPVDVICRTRRLAAIKSVTQQPVDFGDFEWSEAPSPIPFFASGSPGEPSTPCFHFHLRAYPGRLWLYLPKVAVEKDWLERSKGFELIEDADERQRWAQVQHRALEASLDAKVTPNVGWTKKRMQAVENIAEHGVILATKGGEDRMLDGLLFEKGENHTFFLRYDPAELVKEEIKEPTIEVQQIRKVDKERHEVVGGFSVVLARDRRR